jgi:hypothetical protein
MTLIFGFYGSVNLQMGPNCSRLIQTNPFLVQSIDVRFCISHNSHLIFIFLLLLPLLLCTNLILFKYRPRKSMSQNLGQCYMDFINNLPWMLRLPGLKHIIHLSRPVFTRHISYYLYNLFLNLFSEFISLKIQLFFHICRSWFTS